MRFWLSTAALAVILVGALALVFLVPAANDYLTAFMQCSIAVATLGLLAHTRWHRHKAQTHASSAVPKANYVEGKVHGEADVVVGGALSAGCCAVAASDEGGAPVASAAPRLDYLDNLKVVLTTAVVVYHVTACFIGTWHALGFGAYANSFKLFGLGLIGLLQSFFMPLFFFVSGLFTPGTFARKGPHGFLIDKAWRLGVPFLAYIYGLGPGVNAMGQLFAGAPVRYNPSSGPLWFVGWLLVFNAAYCLLGDPGPLPAPGLPKLLLWGCGVGLVQYVLMMAVGQGQVISWFLMMPLTFGSLPFDIIFFGCGCVAKHNKWLEQVPLSGWGGSVLYPLAGFVAAALVAATMVMSDEGVAANPDISSWPLWAKLLGPVTVLLYGAACTVLSLAVVQLFKSRFNVTGPRWKFFAEAAYCVYLIHYVVVILLVGAYVSFLRSLGENIEFWLGGTTSSSRLSCDGWLWLGWAGTCVLAVAIVFPLAAGLRRLPVLRDML